MKVKIEGVPFEMETACPDSWEVTGNGLAGSAGAATDLFVNPFGGRSVRNAPALLFPVSGDFALAAEVQVDFRATFDAGALLLWHDEDHWAKLCFEFSPQAKG